MTSVGLQVYCAGNYSPVCERPTVHLDRRDCKMESCEVIVCRDAIVNTSSFAYADVIVTQAPFNEERESFFSDGHLVPDENLQIVEAVSVAASEIEQGKNYHREIRRRSRSGIEQSDRNDDSDEEGSPCGKEPYVGEQGTRMESPFEGKRLGYEQGDDELEKQEGGFDQSVLIESMQRLAVSNGVRRKSTGNANSYESDKKIEEPDQANEHADSDTHGDVLARGPTGGVAVAYPSSTLNCGWIEQPYPGGKRSQFPVPDFTELRNDIFVDATGNGWFHAEEGCTTVQPSKFRKGPQPVESEDLPPLNDPFLLPFSSLSPKDLDDVLGTDDLTNILDDFFLPDSIYTDPNHLHSQNFKHEICAYSSGDQLVNGLVAALPPPPPPPSILQHSHLVHQNPSHSRMTAFPTTSPITAASPLSEAPTPTTNPPGKFLQPSKIRDPTHFCNRNLNLGGCTSFQAGEASPPESGYGGSDYSQSPHPSTVGSPGREDNFPQDPSENLPEIEAILSFLANEVHPPTGKQSPEPSSSTNHRFSPENPLTTLALDQFHLPPYSTVGSTHPVHSPPIQGSSTSSLPSNTTPAMPAVHSVRSAIRKSRQEGPAEPTMRRNPPADPPKAHAQQWSQSAAEKLGQSSPMGTCKADSNVLNSQLKADQSLNERKQLAKASSVIARLTRDQLAMSDSDQDTLLHLAVAKNERFLTEALINRLDRDKLTASMINLKNKQGQTPLCLATVTNQSTLVRLLIDRGADVNVPIPLGDKQTKSFCNPLHFAASNGKEWLRTLEQLLLAKTIDLSALDSEGCSALHKAVMTNGLRLFYGRNCEIIDSRKSVEQLILRGCDINQQDVVQRKTALHIAIERGDLDLFYYILDLAGPRVSLPLLLNVRTGRRGDTLLHVATTLQITPSHQLTLVRRMLNCGANPHLRNWDNRLPWELATRLQIAEILKVPVAVGV